MYCMVCVCAMYLATETFMHSHELWIIVQALSRTLIDLSFFSFSHLPVICSLMKSCVNFARTRCCVGFQVTTATLFLISGLSRGEGGRHGCEGRCRNGTGVFLE